MVGKSVSKLSKTDVVRSHGHLSYALPPAVCRRDTLTLRLKIVKCMGFPWAIIGIIIGLDQLYQGKRGQYHFHDTA